MNSHINRSTISFFPLDPFDVNNILGSVTLNHFTNLLSLVVTTNNLIKLNNINYFIFNKMPCHTCTSSSFLMGIDLTPYFCLNSFESGALIIRRRICDGALKCFFLFFLLDEVTNLFNFTILIQAWTYDNEYKMLNTWTRIKKVKFMLIQYTIINQA